MMKSNGSVFERTNWLASAWTSPRLTFSSSLITASATIAGFGGGSPSGVGCPAGPRTTRSK